MSDGLAFDGGLTLGLRSARADPWTMAQGLCPMIDGIDIVLVYLYISGSFFILGL